MAHKKNQPKHQIHKHKPQAEHDGIVKEAWTRMSRDFEKLMPQKFRARKDKKKFVFWLFILEVVVLGVIGKMVYEWWSR